MAASAAAGALLLLAGAGAAWFWFSPAARHRRLHRLHGDGSAKPQTADGREVSNDLVAWVSGKPGPSECHAMLGPANNALHPGSSNDGSPRLKPQPLATDALPQHSDSAAFADDCSKRTAQLRCIEASQVCAWDGAAGHCVQLLRGQAWRCLLGNHKSLVN